MKQRVALMVPLSFRTDRTPDEEVSYRHMIHFLGRYDKYLVVPQGTRVRWPGFEVLEFPRKFFGSAEAHTRLLLRDDFYRSFDRYEYMLIHHLDSLVFSDRLEAWCDRDLDYIGAPWFPNADTPWAVSPMVGNGGLCLRRIESIRKVLHSKHYMIDPEEYWRQFSSGRSPWSRGLNLPRKFFKRLRPFNGIRRHLAGWKMNEDRFWALHAARYHPEFRFADFPTALEFAFETAPRVCFELNGGRLPFGCHAWTRYDRQFWEPHLLPETWVESA